MEEFDHDGNFHGAGGVERFIGVVEPFRLAIEGVEGDSNVGVRDRQCCWTSLGGGGELRILGMGGRGREEEECGEGEEFGHGRYCSIA